MRHWRVLTLAVVLASLMSLATSGVAFAAGDCFGELGFDRNACEAAHHSPVMAVGGAGIGILAGILAAFFASGYSGYDVPTGPIEPLIPQRGGGRGPRPEGDGGGTATLEGGTGPSPRDLGLPDVDPWNEPIVVREDGMVFWTEGYGENGDGWVTAERARELLGEAGDAVKLQDQQRADAIVAGEQMMRESTAQMVARNNAQAEFERAWRDAYEDRRDAMDEALQDFEQIERSAERRGDSKVLDALTNDVWDENGNLVPERVQALSDLTHRLIRREQQSEQRHIDALTRFEDDSYISAVLYTTNEVAQNPLVRIGAGMATGGASEILFQAGQAGEQMFQDALQAAEYDQDYGVSDALFSGLGSLYDQNKPTAVYNWGNDIYERIQRGESVTLGDIGRGALAVLGDVGAINDLRNYMGGLRTGLSGGGIRAALTHEAPPIEWSRLLGRGDDVPTNTRLWNDPHDIEWQTGNVSIRNIDDLDVRTWSEGRFGEGTAGRLDDIPPGVQRRVMEVETSRGPLGGVEDEAFRVGRAEGQARVQSLTDAHAELDAARSARDPGRVEAAQQRVQQATLDVQGDKHAMHALNDLPRDPAGNNWVIRRFNDELDGVYRTADDAAIPEIANRMGVDPSEVEIVKITNADDIDGVPGNKASYDRDVTARYLKDGEWVDVPVEVTGELYNQAFWKATTNDAPMPMRIDANGNVLGVDDAALAEYAKRYDQMPTDKLDAEAYGAGPRDLETSTRDEYRWRRLSDPEQVGLTIRYKVDHWLNESMADWQKGDFAGSMAKLEEGQRQLVKQFDNWGVKRTEAMNLRGTAEGASIPPQLRQEVDVLRMVGTDGITPQHAEDVLRSMGTSTRQVADRLANYQEALQKLSPTSPGVQRSAAAVEQLGQSSGFQPQASDLGPGAGGLSDLLKGPSQGPQAPTPDDVLPQDSAPDNPQDNQGESR